ncbi:MAG: hypothetical protein ABW328_00640 [Ilumatobacteraceae bacterium]
MRRSLLIEVGAGLRILGSCYSPDTRRLREFAARNRVPHRFIDLEQDPAAEESLRQVGVRPEETPIVIRRRDCVLRKPSNVDLARLIGLPAPERRDRLCDLLIVGAGPAGLAAAVYGASESLETVVLDRTISVSRRVCRGANLPIARCCRRRSSGPTCASQGKLRPGPPGWVPVGHAERRDDDDGPCRRHRHGGAVSAPRRT